MKNLFILSNSPGEVAGWVKPVANELSKRNCGARVTLAVLPCPYASGMEARYGREIKGIDAATTFRALWQTGDRSVRKEKNLVLQLGGDPMFGAFLSLKFGAGWMIYTSRPKWKSRITHYFIPDEKAEARFIGKRIQKERYTRVGNLALDSIPRDMDKNRAKEKLGLGAEEKMLAFLPGSRPFEYEQGFPFFARAAEEVQAAFPEFHTFMPVAPTVDETILKDGLKRYGYSWLGGDRVERIVTKSGHISLVWSDTDPLLKAADLAVAFPGTNNLQMAAMGTPLVMFAPLNEAENIPLDGIPGIFPTSSAPAKRLKKKLVFWYSGKHRFVSLPNILSGEMIVPEYRGAITPHVVADVVKDLLGSPEKLAAIQEGYRKIDFEFGAAEKIAAKIEGFFCPGQSGS